MQELLRHLVEESTTSQFNLLLLRIRDGLDACQLRAGNYRVRPKIGPDNMNAFVVSYLKIPETV